MKANQNKIMVSSPYMMYRQRRRFPLMDPHIEMDNTMDELISRDISRSQQSDINPRVLDALYQMKEKKKGNPPWAHSIRKCLETLLWAFLKWANVFTPECTETCRQK